MQKNDEIVLKITDYTSEGSGIGRYDGMAVFVPLAAIGDTVKVKVLKVKKPMPTARLWRLLSRQLTEQRLTAKFSANAAAVFTAISVMMLNVTLNPRWFMKL